ncbi:MAG TPA: L,D-transpeptidase [Polyangia bacterium]
MPGIVPEHAVPERNRHILAALLVVLSPACDQKRQPMRVVAQGSRPDAAGAATVAPAAPVEPWDPKGSLTEGETYALGAPDLRRESVAEARAQGLLDVDLSDEWAPFIFSESDGPGKSSKPNSYRATFIALANDRRSPEELLMETPQGALAALSAAGVPLEKGAAESSEGRRAIAEAKRAVRVQRDRNYLEAYGIPPTLSVLLGRFEEDRGKGCYTQVDLPGLASFDGTVTYQSREQSKREYGEALSDAAWVEKLLAGDKSAADATTGKVQMAPSDGTANSDESRDALLVRLAREDRKTAARVERYHRGQVRLRAVRAVQARLVCEGLLSPRSKHVHGFFDLATNQALAAWERKNDIFGWGFLGGETLAALQRPQMELHFDTFRRILMERIADAAGIIEDGSAAGGKRPAGYKDAAGKERPVPNLIGDYADALMAELKVRTPDDVATFLRRVGREGLATLHVAYRPGPLPPYYGPHMELSVEIDRGDVWYDFPFDDSGKPIVQQRVNFPTLTVFVDWQKQKIPLVRWRTTIGSWRSEIHSNGKVYYKYKNSDVGPRIWQEIVASPVWIPPDSTPAKELLTRKTLDRDVGPVTVVNTDVMGPGFQSAYGLVLAIHHRKSGGNLSDNQIRTHGSDDYTSIARRFSHGCHRLVNNRAVRMFDFILRRRAFERVGNQAINLRKRITYEDKQYEYLLDTRGYYYELKQPIPVLVTEGRVMGKTKHPVEAYVPKPGVDYGNGEDESSGP